MSTPPPRLAEWILRRFLSEEDAETVSGDFEETARARVVSGFTPRATRYWYWRQTLSIVWAHLRPDFEPSDQQQPRRPMPAMRQDLSYAFRSLRKQPAFALMAIAMLALGIGANVAIFSLVNALLLKPLPFDQPDRLMLVHMLVPERESGTLQPMVWWSYPKYRVLRDTQRVFDGTSLFTSRESNVTGTGMPERITSELVEFSYFDVLRVAPQIGRTFSAEETRAPGSAPLAVLGHAFWTRRFAGDPGVIGKTIGLNGVSHTVLGVLPPGFRGLSGQTQIWLPVMMLPKEDLEEAWSHSYRLVARRNAGVSADQAEAAVRVIGNTIADQFRDPEQGPRWSATAVPMNDERVDPLVRRSMLLLLASVAGVLLIVCVNLANLTLARALARQREVAIRLALGASRLRIVRQLMTESLLLAGLGAAAGLAVAYAFLSVRIEPDAGCRHGGAARPVSRSHSRGTRAPRSGWRHAVVCRGRGDSDDGDLRVGPGVDGLAARFEHDDQGGRRGRGLAGLARLQPAKYPARCRDGTGAGPPDRRWLDDQERRPPAGDGTGVQARFAAHLPADAALAAVPAAASDTTHRRPRGSTRGVAWRRARSLRQLCAASPGLAT